MTKIKYDRSEEEWQKCLTDETRHKIGLTWLKDGDTLNNSNIDQERTHLVEKLTVRSNFLK